MVFLKSGKSGVSMGAGQALAIRTPLDSIPLAACMVKICTHSLENM